MEKTIDYYSEVREPKTTGHIGYEEGWGERIVRKLQSYGINTAEYTINEDSFMRYFHDAGYRSKYPHYFPDNIWEKSLEHYIAADLLKMEKNEVYIDIASSNSVVPEIYTDLYGVKAYRQDLIYPQGFNGDRIGGDAANMPLPDGFVDKMALHCSFEHFEGYSDMKFAIEAKRVLKAGGALCIVPLYLAEDYVIHTDPKIAVEEGVNFEEGVTVHCIDGWKNRFGRFYDPGQLVNRVCNLFYDCDLTVYRIMNTRSISNSCYAKFVLLVRKPWFSNPSRS